VTITLTDQARRVIEARARRARIKLADLADAEGTMFTALELARMADLDAIDFADAFGLDLDEQPTICTLRRVHPAHGTCKGLDGQGVIDLTDRMLDDAL
jgi:hypothetical protein